MTLDPIRCLGVVLAGVTGTEAGQGAVQCVRLIAQTIGTANCTLIDHFDMTTSTYSYTATLYVSAS